ncbi:MAG TPA: chemotaxis protein CheW [Elusimicrobia bacterium]|nr:chemotaxis protein CheW [Elusimicrobiota bacterium]
MPILCASTVWGAGSAPQTAYFLVFQIDDHRYAVAMESVERVVRAFAPAQLPKGPASVSGLLNLHGRVIPLLNIRHIFGLPERELRPQDYFIIATGAAGACAIAADSVPCLTGCRPEELMPAEAEVRGNYIDRVIKARDGLILIFDPARLPPHEEITATAEGAQ